MLIPSSKVFSKENITSLSRRVNANSQRRFTHSNRTSKLIKKGEC